AEADASRSQVWISSKRGGDARTFTGGPTRDREPRWSTNGSHMAFISDRDGTAQLYVMPADGGEARKLTSIPQGAANPVWSPDSSRVAVVVRTGGDEAMEKKPKNKPARIITELKHKMNGDGYTFDRRR